MKCHAQCSRSEECCAAHYFQHVVQGIVLVVRAVCARYLALYVKLPKSGDTWELRMGYSNKARLAACDKQVCFAHVQCTTRNVQCVCASLARCTRLRSGWQCTSVTYADD